MAKITTSYKDNMLFESQMGNHSAKLTSRPAWEAATVDRPHRSSS